LSQKPLNWRKHEKEKIEFLDFPISGKQRLVAAVISQSHCCWRGSGDFGQRRAAKDEGTGCIIGKFRG